MITHRWDTFPQHVCQTRCNKKRSYFAICDKRSWIFESSDCDLIDGAHKCSMMLPVHRPWGNTTTSSCNISGSNRGSGNEAAKWRSFNWLRTNCKSLGNAKLNRASFTIFALFRLFILVLYVLWVLFIISCPPAPKDSGLTLLCRQLQLRVSDVIFVISLLAAHSRYANSAVWLKRIFLVLNTKLLTLLAISQSPPIFRLPRIYINPNHNWHFTIMT